MPYLSKINNPNPNTKIKVNYFCDYFNFVNARLGELPETEFENPLSLIDKAIYQIKTNLDKSSPYLKNYLSNDLLKSEPFLFLSKFESYEKCSIQIEKYLSLKSNKTKKIAEWIKNTPSLLDNLILLRKELEEKWWRKLSIL